MGYYRTPPHENLWDDPFHTGINTWQDWHGPRLKTDAPLMERMDRLDEQKADWDAKKMFVNTTRVGTLDRFYNRKLQRTQFERSSSWAPHHRARREVHGIYECFDGDLDGAPVKELKKVLTPSVLQKDQEAISAITKRLQNEETWKVAWRAMEQYRRQDTLQDFRRRSTYNDMLEQMAGQPARRRDPHHIMPNNCSKRTEELAKPKQPYVITDITRMTDYRGLVHADSQLALEALFPGAGHEESLRIKAETTALSRAGNLHNEQNETDGEKTLNRSRARSDTSLLSRLSKNIVPTSQS